MRILNDTYKRVSRNFCMSVKNTRLGISGSHLCLLSGRLPFFLIFPSSYFVFFSSFSLTCLLEAQQQPLLLFYMSAWRPMCMRRVINEFVRVSFTVPLQPTHELSIVEETDDFFPLLRSHRSSSRVFFSTGLPSSPFRRYSLLQILAACAFQRL